MLERIQNSTLRLVIPEDDYRIKKAVKTLKHKGIDILDIENFRDHIEGYVCQLKSKPFTRQWSDELFYKYLEEPINLAALSVAFGDADGLISRS